MIMIDYNDRVTVYGCRLVIGLNELLQNVITNYFDNPTDLHISTYSTENSSRSWMAVVW
jgi:hypothetical protein